MFLRIFLLETMAMLRVFCDLIVLLDWQGRESLVRVSSSRERESCNTIRTVFCVESERQTDTQRGGFLPMEFSTSCGCGVIMRMKLQRSLRVK
jgi:hypothetical protein